MKQDVTHIGKANSRRLLKAKAQLESALTLVNSVLEGEPHWPSYNISNARSHSEDAVEVLRVVLARQDEGLTERQKRENPDVI